MSEVQLNARLRENRSKSANQKLWRHGKIPAVLYGPRGNFPLEMEEQSTRQLLEKMPNSHEMVILNVDGPGKNDHWQGKVLLQEIQKHVYKNMLVHLDFREPQQGRPLNLRVQIRVVGESPGVKKGGVLQRVVRELPVSCMPEHIPSYIEIDVSQLDMGQTLKVQDIQLPEHVSLKTRQNFPVLSVVGRAMTLEEEEEVLAAEEAVEEEETEEEAAQE